MQFIIADTFQKGLTKLEKQDQSLVKETVFDFQTNPEHPGHKFHRLKRCREKNFWSVYVNRDIRMIIYKDGERFMLCYVDHHDAGPRDESLRASRRLASLSRCRQSERAAESIGLAVGEVDDVLAPQATKGRGRPV